MSRLRMGVLTVLYPFLRLVVVELQRVVVVVVVSLQSNFEIGIGKIECGA